MYTRRRLEFPVQTWCDKQICWNYAKEDTADGPHGFCHNPIFALFSPVAIQREQRKKQEQGNVRWNQAEQ